MISNLIFVTSPGGKDAFDFVQIIILSDAAAV